MTALAEDLGVFTVIEQYEPSTQVEPDDTATAPLRKPRWAAVNSAARRARLAVPLKGHHARIATVVALVAASSSGMPLRTEALPARSQTTEPFQLADSAEACSVPSVTGIGVVAAAPRRDGNTSRRRRTGAPQRSARAETVAAPEIHTLRRAFDNVKSPGVVFEWTMSFSPAEERWQMTGVSAR